MTPKEYRQARIAKGLCPSCGKEAAPFYLCWDCRQMQRIHRAGKRLAHEGVILNYKENGRVMFKLAPGGLDKPVDNRWATTVIPPKDDRRFSPKLRGARVNVEATLVEVIRHIGRGCTIEEIMAGWGRLRDKRTSPLAHDLARIIAADDKRKRKAAKLMEAQS